MSGGAVPPTLNGHRRPTLVIVSGRPGSGKTTLARRLSVALSSPLVSRDEINEGIYHTFGHDPGAADKDQVAKLTFDTFSRALKLLLESQVSLVAEAAFQDRLWRIVLDPLVSIADLRLIACTVDQEAAYDRMLRRRSEAADPIRSARESAEVRAGEWPPPVRGFEPLSLPMPSIQVATHDGYDPRIEEIIAFARG